jgi:hypothetical protein
VLAASVIALLRITLFLLVFSVLLPQVEAVPPDPPPFSTSVTANLTGPTGNLRLIGYASPNALITFLHEGSVMGTVVASAESLFDKTFTGFLPGVQNFSLYGSDATGRTTLTLGFDTNIISGSTITLSGFLLPPTLIVAKPTLKRPDAQVSSGLARQDATVTAFFNSDPISKQVPTNTDGKWEARVSEIFHLGTHSASALVQDKNGSQSILSQSLPFNVILSADLNIDDFVNLIDFSILMFNYGTAQPKNKAADINDNGPVDLIDFSVMMFHWTGG